MNKFTFGMAAVLVALAVSGTLLLGQVYAQEAPAEPTIDEAVDSAVQLVVSISMLVSAAAGFAAWILNKAGLTKLAHSAEGIAGTDEEVLARLNEIRAVVKGAVAFEPRLGEYLQREGVDIETLGKKADTLTEEINRIHKLGSAIGTAPAGGT